VTLVVDVAFAWDVEFSEVVLAVVLVVVELLVSLVVLLVTTTAVELSAVVLVDVVF
jgi:hypothetical protein